MIFWFRSVFVWFDFRAQGSGEAAGANQWWKKTPYFCTFFIRSSGTGGCLGSVSRVASVCLEPSHPAENIKQRLKKEENCIKRFLYLNILGLSLFLSFSFSELSFSCAVQVRVGILLNAGNPLHFSPNWPYYISDQHTLLTIHPVPFNPAWDLRTWEPVCTYCSKTDRTWLETIVAHGDMTTEAQKQFLFLSGRSRTRTCSHPEKLLELILRI